MSGAHGLNNGLNRLLPVTDPRHWVEAAVLGDGRERASHALLRMLASDVTMRRYAGGLLWARLVAETMPRALVTLEAVMDDEKSGAANRINAVRLTAELAGLLSRTGESLGAGLAGAVGEVPEVSAERLIEVGREASAQIARLERRLASSGADSVEAGSETITPAW